MDFASGRSTDAAKTCLAAALVEAGAPAAAKRVEDETNWRANYWKHFVEVNATCLRSQPTIAVQMCAAGLSACRSAFSFGGLSLGEIEAARSCGGGSFEAEIVSGTGAELPFVCPLDGRDQTIEQLTSSVAALVDAGAAEPSVLVSLHRLCGEPSWLKRKAIDDSFVFAVLGACSQMGPARTFLALGGTVLAIDLHGRDKMWAELVAFAEATPGRLIIPTRTDSGRGCDVLSDFSTVAEWIVETAATYAPGRRICLGTFLYADGGTFARLAVAADAVTAAVCAARPDTAHVSLCSPTECFSVPEEARAEAARRYSTVSVHTPWMRAVEAISRKRYLERNTPQRILRTTAAAAAEEKQEGDHSVVKEEVAFLQDSYVWQQGPNYALAKQIQRWRNIVLWWEGSLVSSSVAPASLTLSVTHNKLIRAGMLGPH